MTIDVFVWMKDLLNKLVQSNHVNNCVIWITCSVYSRLEGLFAHYARAKII